MHLKAASGPVEARMVKALLEPSVSRCSIDALGMGPPRAPEVAPLTRVTRIKERNEGARATQAPPRGSDVQVRTFPETRRVVVVALLTSTTDPTSANR